jgi:Sel1 repeat-containing protein
MTFLRMCRPIYRLRVTVFWIGILLSGIGLVIGLFGRGWTALVIGIGFVVLGIITSQIPVVYLGNEVKLIDESLTPKQVSNLVSRHLREHGDGADDTAVFLGKFGGEVEVVKKYRKAAEQGHAEAQYRLGSCYREGFGVQQDDAEATKWYRKAAEQGYIPTEKENRSPSA